MEREWSKYYGVVGKVGIETGRKNLGRKQGPAEKPSSWSMNQMWFLSREQRPAEKLSEFQQDSIEVNCKVVKGEIGDT
jgi:hypothetical protein